MVLLAAALFVSVTGTRGQSFSMQIIADNDFAIFGGTATSKSPASFIKTISAGRTRLNNLSSFTFELQPGQTTFYVLGMGGGGMENISGTINDIDMTSINVLMSSDLSSFLTGYFSEGSPSSSVGVGTYDASLFDVPNSFLRPDLGFANADG